VEKTWGKEVVFEGGLGTAPTKTFRIRFPPKWTIIKGGRGGIAQKMGEWGGFGPGFVVGGKTSQLGETGNDPAKNTVRAKR